MVRGTECYSSSADSTVMTQSSVKVNVTSMKVKVTLAIDEGHLDIHQSVRSNFFVLVFISRCDLGVHVVLFVRFSLQVNKSLIN